MAKPPEPRCIANATHASEHRSVRYWSGEINATTIGEVFFNHVPIPVADDATTMIKPMMESCLLVVRRSPWGRLGRLVARDRLDKYAAASRVRYISTT